jgi:hypothetical protein
MEEGRELSAVLDSRVDERLLGKLTAAVSEAPPAERLLAGVEAFVEIAEADPEGTREALWALRGNQAGLREFERGLGLEAHRATLALGAAIQLASAELAAEDPNLRRRVPELVRWLEGSW